VFELLCCFILSACSSNPRDQTHSPLSNAYRLPDPDLTIDIPSLSNCTQSDDSILHLNSREPVTVIVHGCFSSAGRFRSLADVFAFHGQQAICFNYNDRDKLSNSSTEFINAIEKLSGHLHQPKITVIGHSQGGLVARRALIGDRPDRLEADDTQIRLITISTPFGGIKSASHCGSKPMAWFSLGITKLICQLVTGSKYREIPPNSEFINAPGDLIPTVNEHLKIATDELETCRRYNERGNCVEDDFVFSLDEQMQPAIDDDTNLSSIVVKSGHVEIVGNGETEPTKLIDILQQQGVLSLTLPERAEELSHLMKQLYLDERTE
jgi:hypothetical protein